MTSPAIDVIGFGALNIDLVYEISESTAARLQVKPGKEQAGIELGSMQELLNQLATERLLHRSGGGSAANVVVALSRLGFKTGYLGKVGTDEEANSLLSNLPGVDTSQIQRGPDKSGLVFSMYTRDHKDRFLAVYPGENDAINASDIDIDYVNQAKVIHYTSFVGDHSFNAQIEILAKINPQVLVSFDGGELYSKRGLEAIRPFLQTSHIIFPSTEEVATLTGLDYKFGAKKLLELGPSIVVVTLGSKGCYVLTRAAEFHSPALPVPQADIIDTTGAGDVFVAGFLAGILRKQPLASCAGFANRLAAKSITGLGRTKYPSTYDLKYL